nr:peroxygenase [Quercus suber]
MTAVITQVAQGLPDKNGTNLDRHPQAKLVVKQHGQEINNYPAEKPYSLALDAVPVTVERLPYYPRPGDQLQDPGTARVNLAVSNEAPRGTTEGGWAAKHAHQTVVQQHCAYFDRDGDGIIWPLDTYHATRAWGWNPLLALIAMVIIHLNLSYACAPSWLPDPFFRLWIANMHKNKHGSDSMTYDAEGRFRPQNFEDLFAKYDRDGKGGLDVYDVIRMHKGQRLAMDFWGWSATALECELLADAVVADSWRPRVPFHDCLMKLVLMDRINQGRQRISSCGRKMASCARMRFAVCTTGLFSSTRRISMRRSSAKAKLRNRGTGEAWLVPQPNLSSPTLRTHITHRHLIVHIDSGRSQPNTDRAPSGPMEAFNIAAKFRWCICMCESRNPGPRLDPGSLPRGRSSGTSKSASNMLHDFTLARFSCRLNEAFCPAC